MSIEQSRKVFEAFKRAANEDWQDIEAMVSLFSDECAEVQFGGRDGLRQIESEWRVAFPVWHQDFDHVVLGEDGFACGTRIRASNGGSFRGNNPTYRDIDIETALFFKLDGDKICEYHVVGDEARGAEMYRQLGLAATAEA